MYTYYTLYTRSFPAYCDTLKLLYINIIFNIILINIIYSEYMILI